MVDPARLSREALLDHTHGYLLASASNKFAGTTLRFVGLALLHDLHNMTDDQLRRLYAELLS